MQRDLDLRPLRRELAQQRRQHARADALVRADPQRPGVAGVERGEVGLRGLEPGGDRVGVPQEQRAGLGQRDGAGPAGAVDQPLADDPLQRGDLLADRRLRVAEAGGGAAEGALLGDRLEGDRDVAARVPSQLSVCMIEIKSIYGLVLMATARHSATMEMIVFLALLLLAGVFSVVGPERRDLDDTDRRGWWPGHSRR